MSAPVSSWFDDAVHRGADRVIEELQLGERDIDLINLVRAAISTTLVQPEAPLDDAITEHFSHSAQEVRSWWSDWT